MHTKNENTIKPTDRTDYIQAGIIMLIIACTMAAVPSILAIKHVLDLSSANVLFGMAVWYIFAVITAAFGIRFVRSGAALTVSDLKQTA